MIVHYHSLPDKGAVLPRLWSSLCADELPPWLWGNGPALSLTEFILYFSDPGRHLFLVLTPDTTNCVAMLWVDEITWGHRARAHFYFFKRYRNERALRVGAVCRRVLTALAQPPFNLRLLLLFIDHRAQDALRLARAFGVTFLGEIPNYYPGGHPTVLGHYSLEGVSHDINLRRAQSAGTNGGHHGPADVHPPAQSAA